MKKTRRPGIEAKEKILNVSRVLFYENGFRETAFGEICKAADVGPGTIAYHFGSKVKIGETIYANMMQVIQNRLLVLFDTMNELDLLILGIAVHLRMMFLDSGYRRFNAQILSDCMDVIEKDQYARFSPLTHKFFTKYAESSDLSFYMAATAGADSRINAYISQHIDTLDYAETLKNYAQYCTRNVDKEDLADAIKRAIFITERMQISIDNFEAVIELK